MSWTVKSRYAILVDGEPANIYTGEILDGAPFGVHRAGFRRWTVTHTPTGYSFGSYRSRRNARSFAEIASALPLDWRMLARDGTGKLTKKGSDLYFRALPALTELRRVLRGR